MNKIRFNLNRRVDKKTTDTKLHSQTKNAIVKPGHKGFGKKLNDKEILILMVYRHPKGVLKYSSGETINPSAWNPTQQRAREQSSTIRGKLVNAHLDRMERTLNDILTHFNQKGIIPSTEMLREELDIRFRGKALSPGKIDNVMEYIDVYIRERGQSSIRPNTLKNYRSTKHWLEKWLKGRRLLFTSMTNNDYREFKEFLQNQSSAPQDSTVAKYIKTLKAFINAAVADERTVATTNPYNNKSLGIKIRDSVNVALYEHEIEMIRTLNLKEYPHLEPVRDLLIVACWTGLRISDLKKLRSENIRKENTGYILEMEATKTTNSIVVPLKPIVVDILEKYEYKIVNLSEKEIRDDIKRLGELAGINKIIKKRIHRKGQMTEVLVPKFKLLATHTGRRSFITNGLIFGMSPTEMMPMTGHKTLKSFENYLKHDDVLNARRLHSIAFFQ